jgi:sortase A
MPGRGIRRSPRGRWLLVAVSVLCVAAGLALITQVGWFLSTSSSQGTALIGREQLAIRAAGRTCLRPAGSASPPGGLLEVPTLGLVAPVLQGTGTGVLAHAVGHVPASAWPGRAGTTVLAAHDVTWFSRIDRLRAGDQIRYITPCRTFVYRVTAHQVVQAGYPVYDTSAARIVLDTCYPLDALYTTSRRYLVYASLVTALSTSAMPPAPPSPATIWVPAPKALAAEGLGLQQNEAPLGTLGLSGSWSPGWSQTSAPLGAEVAALSGYFGVIRSAEQGELSWWQDLAPSVPAAAAAAIWNGKITGYDTRLRIILRVKGNRVTGATLTAVLALAGRSAAYDLTATETVTPGDRLVVSGFALLPTGLAPPLVSARCQFRSPGKPPDAGGQAMSRATILVWCGSPGGSSTPKLRIRLGWMRISAGSRPAASGTASAAPRISRNRTRHGSMDAMSSTTSAARPFRLTLRYFWLAVMLKPVTSIVPSSGL